MNACEQQFLEEQKTETEQMIKNYNAAIRFLTLNPTESYKFDTGQSEQEVKRHNLSNMRESRAALMNEYAMICQRLNTSQTTLSIPGW